MNTPLPGFLIRKERTRRQWSQSGLCRGICAVSYLSKIEQGKAEASEEVLNLLFGRLEMPWHSNQQALAHVSGIIEDAYEAVFSYDAKKSEAALQQLGENRELCRNGPFRLDALLLECWLSDQKAEDLQDFEPIFSLRQRTLWLLMEERFDELLYTNPIAFSYLFVGKTEYHRGNYAPAQEHLQRGYELAAREGLVSVMLLCKLLLGNCYSNLLDFDRMTAHYRVAGRLAEAISDSASLRDIEYNTAATGLEVGRTEEAYRAFCHMEQPSALTLHKLAVCCERLGKREEARAALQKAETAPQEFPEHGFVLELCALVRYRLDHSDYLHRAEYGAALLSCFERMRRELPSGYAGFHLPWVIEWYKAARQYKQAYELLRSFPDHGRFIEL